MKKLLIITQKVDREDPVLGFFHGWISRLAEEFKQITAICLREGRHSLPANVSVLSLGKEAGESKLKYLLRFYQYIWRERKNYEAVFVHMNKIYVILGWVWWRLGRKKICLWYNHKQGGWLATWAIWLADKVFYTSPFSFAARFSKAKKMPAGIDTRQFKRREGAPREKNSLLYLGRIAPIKNIDTLIDAAKILDEQGADFFLKIIGDADDQDYLRELKAQAKELREKGKIKFLPGVPHNQTPPLYNQSEVFINLTNSGSLDKTTLEAMACQALVLTSNRSYVDVLPLELLFEERSASDLAEKIKNIFNRGDKEELRHNLNAWVDKNHSLDLTVASLNKNLQ